MLQEKAFFTNAAHASVRLWTKRKDNIDEMNIFQIQSWDGIYWFALPLNHFVTPKRRVFNRRGLSFASLPTGWILYTPKVFTHTYMYMNHAHISIKVHLYYKWLIIKKRLERRNHAADVMWRTQDVSMWGKDVREGRVEGYRDEHINKTYKLSNIKQFLNM